MDQRMLIMLLLQDNNIMQNQYMLMNNFFTMYDLENEMIQLAIAVCLCTNEMHLRVDNYYEDWLPHYLNHDFFSLFRMTKESFNNLLNRLHCTEKLYTGGGMPVSPELQLLMTLWWLGKGEVLLSVSDKFNVALSTVHKSTEYILNKIIELLPIYIVWPDAREIIKVKRDFHEKCGFPGVIGAVDGCNIPFKAPMDQQESYIDRYLDRSIKLQAVVTCQKIFTNIMVGMPGSIHDSRVLRQSTLFMECEERGNTGRFFPNDKHLIGDSGYPLYHWLMTPYRNNGHLTQIQRRYNTSHSVTRIPVEHAFGILQGRWRILKYINVNSVEKAVKVLTACCVLHNFCYINDDFWFDYAPLRIENDEFVVGNAEHHAVNKRNQIANNLIH